MFRKRCSVWFSLGTLQGSLALLACEGPLPAESPKTQVDQRAEVMPIIEGQAAGRFTQVLAFEGIGLETPESVLYDAARDLYLVSNIKGRPDALDGDGFISVLSPDGGVVDLMWLRGGHEGVILNAPKGSALWAGKFWVSDVDTVRRFDVKTGRMERAIPIAGATFLNDVAVAPDGTVYVTDTGVEVGPAGFEPTEVDAIYAIKNDQVSTVAKSPELGQPNGIVVDEEHLYFASMGGNTLRKLDRSGQELARTSLPKGTLDGLVRLGPDEFLVTSWEGEAVYRGGLTGAFATALSSQKAPADIGHDTKRNRLLVPRFLEHQVLVFAVEAAAAEGTASTGSAPAASASGTPVQPAPNASASVAPPSPANPSAAPSATARPH